MIKLYTSMVMENGTELKEKLQKEKLNTSVERWGMITSGFWDWVTISKTGKEVQRWGIDVKRILKYLVLEMLVWDAGRICKRRKGKESTKDKVTEYGKRIHSYVDQIVSVKLWGQKPNCEE